MDKIDALFMRMDKIDAAIIWLSQTIFDMNVWYVDV